MSHQQQSGPRRAGWGAGRTVKQALVHAVWLALLPMAALAQTQAVQGGALVPLASTSDVPSLPADLLNQPAAASCAALRSGTYRRVRLRDSGVASQYTTDTVSINASTLVYSIAGGGSGTLTPLGTCRYSFGGNGTGQAVVSQAGVMLFREIDNNVGYTGLAFPEQSHTVAALAGTWNTLGQERDNGSAGTFSLRAGSLSFNSAGVLTSGQSCPGIRNCSALATTPASRLAVSAGGGFTLVNGPAGRTDRVFAYRAGNGDLMLLQLAGRGSYAFWTQQQGASASAVGTQARRWNLGLMNNLQSPAAVSEVDHTVLSLDNANAPTSYVRRAYTYSGTGAATTAATYAETLRLNQPRAGYQQRVAATATSSSGAPVAVREFFSLPLRGTGLSPVAVPALGSSPAQMALSVLQGGSTWIPANLLARPFAANCAALRSGALRLVEAMPSSSPQSVSTKLLSFDATTLQLGDSSGAVSAALRATLRPTGPCRFTNLAGTAEVVVSQAGVLVFRSTEDDGIQRVGLMFPEQTAVLASLAGTWNGLGWTTQTGAAPFAAEAATITYDAAGTASSISHCQPVTNCTAGTPGSIRTLINSAGGFSRSFAGGSNRQFLYTAGNRDQMLVTLDSKGGLGLWTQRRSNSLPTLGARNLNWDVSLSNQLRAMDSTGIPTSSNTIQSVNSSTGRVVRGRSTSTGASYTETVDFNAPRAGYNHRLPATPVASNGSPVTVREFTSLSLRGMGFSALTMPATPLFMLSVGQP